MHELGIVAEVARIVKDIARRQQLKKIDTIVLQIGELSSVLPYYVEQCYPAAVYGTMLENSRLKIEVLPGNGRCRCGKVFNLLQNRQVCPDCGGREWELLGGREFLIKEIVAC